MEELPTSRDEESAYYGESCQLGDDLVKEDRAVFLKTFGDFRNAYSSDLKACVVFNRAFLMLNYLACLISHSI